MTRTYYHKQTKTKAIFSKEGCCNLETLYKTSPDWEMLSIERESIYTFDIPIEIGKQYEIKYKHTPNAKWNKIKITKITNQGYYWAKSVTGELINGIISPNSHEVREVYPIILPTNCKILSFKRKHDNKEIPITSKEMIIASLEDENNASIQTIQVDKYTVSVGGYINIAQNFNTINSFKYKDGEIYFDWVGWKGYMLNVKRLIPFFKIREEKDNIDSWIQLIYGLDSVHLSSINCFKEAVKKESQPIWKILSFYSSTLKERYIPITGLSHVVEYKRIEAGLSPLFASQQKDAYQSQDNLLSDKRYIIESIDYHGMKLTIRNLFQSIHNNTENKIYSFCIINNDLRIIDTNSKAHNISDIRIKRSQVSKPPLGLKPINIHHQERYLEILEAIKRYVEAFKEVPKEWIAEMETLKSWLK